jgi:large subunit ribosomal protein L19
MNKQAIIRKMDLKQMKSVIPAVKSGQTVRVKTIIKEWEKTMKQVFEWLIIKVHPAWLKTTMTVRKISDWIWVEKIFPIHSPNIESIEITKIAKVRRSKLYYMRERFWKSARMQEKQTTQAERDALMVTVKEEKKEVVTEEKTEEAA